MHSSRCNTCNRQIVGQTDRQTDRRTDGFAIAISRSGCKVMLTIDKTKLESEMSLAGSSGRGGRWRQGGLELHGDEWSVVCV